MFLICEGLDNTGKSTLVGKLAEDLKLLAIANKKRPESIKEVFEYTTDICLLSTRYSIIMDRWQPISESIYGPICRNTQIIKLGDRGILDKMTSDFKAFVIYCRPPRSVVLASIGERPQMEGVVKNLDNLYSAYDDRMFLVARSLPVIIYDYTINDYSNLLSQIKTLLQGPEL